MVERANSVGTNKPCINGANPDSMEPCVSEDSVAVPVVGESRYLLASNDRAQPVKLNSGKQKQIKFGVARLHVSGADPAVAQNIETLLTDGIGAYPQFDVISFQEIQQMLAFEKQKQLAGCESDASCLAEIGGALGVDKLITGNVGYLGETYIVSLQLTDVHTATVESRAQTRVKKGNEQQLVESTDALVRQLIDPLLPHTPFPVAGLLTGSTALTLASAAFGVGMFFQARSSGRYIRQSSWENSVDGQGRLDDLKNTSALESRISNVSFAVAGTFLLSSALLFYLRHRQLESSETNPTDAGTLLPNWRADFALRLKESRTTISSETPPRLKEGIELTPDMARAMRNMPRNHEKNTEWTPSVSATATVHLVSALSLYEEGEVTFNGPLAGARLMTGIGLSLRDFLAPSQKWDFNAHGGILLQRGMNVGTAVGACYEYSFFQGCVEAFNIDRTQEVETGRQSDYFNIFSASLGVKATSAQIVDFYRSRFTTH